MKKLLSLPPNVVGKFHELTGLSTEEYFATSDPVGVKLGSGGGTAWLLHQSAQAEGATSFSSWLSKEKRILVHAGGQSRRLPAYAACGKIQLPIPVFRWARGQKLSQNLLDIQLALYEGIMKEAPESLRTLIVSGDVYIRNTRPLQPIPEADVVCYGLWVDPSLAKNHGVYFMNRQTPDILDFVLQKPSTKRQAELSHTHLALMDIGIWLLSDKAVELLNKRSLVKGCAGSDSVIDEAGSFCSYDLYSDFGTSLGTNPTNIDEELNQLKVVILPLPGGEFYHFGTTPEMISSTMALQSLVVDQTQIIKKGVKIQPSIFVQNSILHEKFTESHHDIWVENSYLSPSIHLTYNNVVTGLPQNSWDLTLEPGQCLDVEAYGEKAFIVRPYGFRDAFRGDIHSDSTIFLGIPVAQWFAAHHISPSDISPESLDLQAAPIFPVVEDDKDMEVLMRWMLSSAPAEDLSGLYLSLPRMSADDISAYSNLIRQEKQRTSYRLQNIPAIAKNYANSIFYQVNLKDVANTYAREGLELPEPLPSSAPIMQQIHDSMFRSQVERLRGNGGEMQERHAFELLRDGLVQSAISTPQLPRLSTYMDQIVFARSSVRIDVAGGWTDTPPHCLLCGGNVVNFAMDLNGQQPLQVYVKPCKEYKIVCRSIDLGAVEHITSFDELRIYNKVGSPFSIPKAALALCGFLPEFCSEKFSSLDQQLQAFGSGLEITLLSAIPAGSGLGTSSILASTVLGALSDFCGLAWDKFEIGNRTLILEQLLTTGGGWQDQYGGILGGIKLLQTEPGFNQVPLVRWLPDTIFTAPEYSQCHLLYYTGITRTAKQILAEIVRGMFLNSSEHLDILAQMKSHALDLFDAVQRNDFEQYGKLVRKTWSQNKSLDYGTEPLQVAKLCSQIDDLCLGYKLPGAGGGGYLYMVAKDPKAAALIRDHLLQNPLTSTSRFVDMSLSRQGLQLSRS